LSNPLQYIDHIRAADVETGLPSPARTRERTDDRKHARFAARGELFMNSIAQISSAELPGDDHGAPSH